MKDILASRFKGNFLKLEYEKAIAIGGRSMCGPDKPGSK
jgi:hypothetical protein